MEQILQGTKQQLKAKKMQEVILLRNGVSLRGYCKGKVT